MGERCFGKLCKVATGIAAKKEIQVFWGHLLVRRELSKGSPGEVRFWLRAKEGQMISRGREERRICHSGRKAHAKALCWKEASRA